MSAELPDDLPLPALRDPRTVSTDVHRHLRRLIVDNTIPAGTVLKQAHLARVFGVSRTPLREAFRMLQEEGLIDTEANQRAVVRALDLQDLDLLYGARILLESLGARLTAGRLTADERSAAEAALEHMIRTPIEEDIEGWLVAHREFHLLCCSRAGGPLLRVIASYGERSERYLRAHQLSHPQAFRAAHTQHRAILDALLEADATRAGLLMGEHLSLTSLAVVGGESPDCGTSATELAMVMVRAGRPR